MNHNKKSIAFSLLLVFVFCATFSMQSQTHTERVTIVGAFQPSLKDATKLNTKPEAIEMALQQSSSQPSYLERIALTLTEAELISPLLTVNIKEKDQRYRNFLQTGMGSNLSPMFLFTHHSALSSSGSFNLELQHLSSWINMPDFAPSPWMQNKAKAGYRHTLNNHILHTNLLYSFNSNNFYGFKPDDFQGIAFTNKDIRQHHQNIGAETGVASNYRNANALHHHAKLGFHRYSNFYGFAENSLKLDGKLSKEPDLFRFDGKQLIELEVDGGFFGTSDSLKNQTNEFGFSIRPIIGLKGSFYEVKAGIRFSMQSDSLSQWLAHPMVSGRLFIFDEKMEFYAGLDGKIQRNSLPELTSENPFLTPALPGYWSNDRYVFSTGIKSGLVKGLDLHAGLQYNETDNDGFYVTDTLNPFHNQFKLVHDYTKRLRFLGEASYQFSNQLVIKLLFAHDQYTTDTISMAWHRPRISFSARGEYRLDEKLRLQLEFLYMGDRYAPEWISGSQVSVKMKDVYDLNMGTSYAINERLGVFARLNNVLHNRYQRFYSYPVQGIQLFGGITYRF